MVAIALSVAPGCAGASRTATAVATVGRTPITRGELDHWIAVLARREYEAVPKGPVPSGVVPDPPRYTACMAYLRARPATVGGGSTSLTTKQLVAQCRDQYTALRELALGSLITGDWLIGEGDERGFKVTATEVSQRVAEVTGREFTNRAAFERYLSYTGETLADERLRSRIKLFSAKIEAQLLKGGAQAQQRAYAKFNAELPLKWAKRTTCLPGYVVPNCKEYRGSAKPEPKLL